MTEVLDQIRDEVEVLKLDDSLLFLNHLLGVSRGDKADLEIERHLQSGRFRPPAFIIHFLTKQILLYSSNVAPAVLDWPRFKKLQDMYFELDDPIVDDPNWKRADPTGFFERLLAQQLPSQYRNMMQRYGLALALFRDSGKVAYPIDYDLRGDIEQELGISLEQFMAMGHVCYALRIASHKGHECVGTFTPMHLAEAYCQGIEFCVPEVWTKFLGRVACDRDEFRRVCDKPLYRASDSRYVQFEFNPLCRFPIIEIVPGRFLAVDPDLIVERVTLGLFYDLFERDGLSFLGRFGHVFDRFIGTLLKSVCPEKSLWSASEWERATESSRRASIGKMGDWAYAGESSTVLIECKSLRPSLELTTYGSEESVEDTVQRIAKALQQLIEQSDRIQQGEWQGDGLSPGPVGCVVVTYGRIRSANGPFVRKRVRQFLEDRGLAVPPFVVLSLIELDAVIRLVELGHPLNEVVLRLAEREDSFDVLQHFHSELKTHAVSKLTYEKCEAFMDAIVRGSGRQAPADTIDLEG